MPESLELFDAPCPGCGETVFTLPLKPRATHRVVCPKCHTPYIVHVASNLSIGVYTLEDYEKAKCSNCKGTGKCPTCKGTGKVPCPDCGGKGYIKEYSNFVGCPRCGGSGTAVYLSQINEKIKR
ncbi:MAG: hypothetical protein ABWK01_03285, partial [Infirmifilum sp.]